MNSKLKVKNRPSNPATDDSEESNQALAGKLDLSCLRQPIATSVTGFEEVLRAYEAGTNEVSFDTIHFIRRYIDHKSFK